MTGIVQLNVNVAITINQRLVSQCGEIFCVNLPLLEGALKRVDNNIYYGGMSDIYDIAANIALSVSKAHAFSNANKRTGLFLCLDYLESRNINITYEVVETPLAFAMADLVQGHICTETFAEILLKYSQP